MLDVGRKVVEKLSQSTGMKNEMGDLMNRIDFAKWIKEVSEVAGDMHLASNVQNFI